VTSKRKIEANRRNAQSSTGPRSLAGKRRISQNALRHGLATGILDDPEKLTQVDQLARVLAPEGHPDKLRWARIVAEAELDLLRVRAARAKLIYLEEVALSHSPSSTAMSQEIGEKPLYEEPTILLSQLRHVSSELDNKSRALLRALPRLALLDRYERRALSRRKRAMLALVQT